MNLLIALNRKKEMTTATRNLCKTDNFYCPSCKGRVYLKIGRINRPHFAHYQNQDCHAFSEGETAEHLEGKLQLATYLKMREAKVQIEAYLPELQQRPDILFEKEGRKIAVEFQCSALSIEKIVERTEGYLDANYEVIWILGNYFRYTNKLTAFQKACLYTTFERKQPMLIHYDASTDYLSVRYDFQTLSNGQMNCQLKQMNLNEKKSIKLSNSKRFKVREKNLREIKGRHERFVREIRYPRPKVQAFLEFLYINKENIVSMPKEIYHELPNEWMIQTYPMHWKSLFFLWLESFPVKKILTMRMLKLWIDQQVAGNLIHYYESPQLTGKMRHQPFIEWIEFLEKRSILKKVGHLKWSYQQPLKRYKTLEEKFKCSL